MVLVVLSRLARRRVSIHTTRAGEIVEPQFRERDDRLGCRLLAVALLLLFGGGYPRIVPAAPDSDVDARLDRLFGEHDPYRYFLRDLQAAVADHARERVAAMVNYPLKTRIHGRIVHLRNPEQFIAHYADLLPPTTQTAIARQSYDSLFASSQGRHDRERADLVQRRLQG